MIVCNQAWLHAKVTTFDLRQTDLDYVVIAVFSVDSLHCTDIKATKHLSTGIHPLLVSGTQRHMYLIITSNK